MNSADGDELNLAEDYRVCRQLNARHGKTFYLATALLPPAKRPGIHALYGFARYADDVIDLPGPGEDPATRLAELESDVRAALNGARAGTAVVRALADTVRRYDICPQLVYDFLAAMTLDLSVTRYQTFADLRGYMWGSAAVIGVQVLPILGVSGDPELARRAAGDLGIAFQLTNFIRDVAEDLARGRVYLPLDSLAAHGVTVAELHTGTMTPGIRALIAAESDRARGFYDGAAVGIGELDRDAQDCVRTASRLYGGILDEIERAGYDVFNRRARVGPGRRLRIGLPAYARAVAARR
ncbi:MAG: phytoene synthase [Frankiales bacterium]|nr:phytoene synthase [Frankiales bacterium]